MSGWKDILSFYFDIQISTSQSPNLMLLSYLEEMAESIILICTSDAGKADESNSIPPLAHNQSLRYRVPQILALFPVSEFQGMCAFLSTLVQQETIIKHLKQLCVLHRNSDLLFFAQKQKASCWMIRR